MGRPIGTKNNYLVYNIRDLIAWRDKNLDLHPALALLHSHHYMENKRSFPKATNGFLAELPHIFMPHPNGIYYGLYIIMLAKSPSTNTKIMTDARQGVSLKLLEYGYKVVIAEEVEDAIKEIEFYLAEEKK